jgi:NADPH-dependent glutamate synthase beta subunit-like oxidoreductase/Pyruvate/2-oxoacid:ferredoxin oxidoreductase delta subunit
LPYQVIIKYKILFTGASQVSHKNITIDDIEPIAPFSRGTTEIFLTGQWSSRKPYYCDKVSPCRKGCPIGVDIARAFYHASLGDYDEALRIYREDNPLPAVCGRVCYHPCELNCNRKEFDEAVNIRGFERFISDRGKIDIKKAAPLQIRKEKIAVIGSGPAGLSASYHLARLGYPVIIFEALPEPGGMLRYGIPEYRLPKRILGKEINNIKKLGVKIKTGVSVGKDVSLYDIKQNFQAVFIAAGAHKSIRMGIPGEELPDVIEGIKFLRDVSSGKKVKLGKKVAVIGGGNTAADCARTARRAGVKDVTVIYRRSRTEMPALPEDVESMEREGIIIEYLAAPLRLVSKKKRLSGIECTRMKLGNRDSGGRRKPIPVKNSEFVIRADTVISAVGQVPDSRFAKDIGVELDKNGIIKISQDSMATGIEGIFAGGDSAGIKAFVADAIASGKTGALAISCFLEGKNFKNEFLTCSIADKPSFSFRHLMGQENISINLKKTISYDKINTLCFTHSPRNYNTDLTPKESISGFKEVSLGLPEFGMKNEIARCFNCGMCTQCDLCFLLCPDVSLKKRNGGYDVNKNYCKGCGMCATSCPRNVIDMEAAK